MTSQSRYHDMSPYMTPLEKNFHYQHFSKKNEKMAGPAAGSRHRARQPGWTGIFFSPEIRMFFKPAFRINISYALFKHYYIIVLQIVGKLEVQ